MGLLTIGYTSYQVNLDPKNPKNVRVLPDIRASQNQLLQRGIILQVEVGVDDQTAETLRQQGNAVPQSISCQALVDTGASALGIETSIATQLGLSRKGQSTNHTANGPRQCSLYAVSLDFPGTSLKKFPIIQASDVNLSQQPFKVLIGRDVMSKWHLHYNGQTGTITIAD